MFTILWTNEARSVLFSLKDSPSDKSRYNAVRKTIRFLAENPRHPGLQTHQFTSLSVPNGEKVFEAYAQQKSPAAYRVFWQYGPQKQQITIITITPHP